MPRTLVVADDLTGATDTAHAFAARGYRTRVRIDPESEPPDTTVLAVNTDSRYADGDTAAERVRAAIDPDALVYRKVDSTLRGNVVSEIDAAMDATNAALAVVAPAAPAVGRVTAGGYHLVDGRLLTDTEYADDPKGPTTAHLPTLLADCEHPVVSLGIETVAAGCGSIREALADAPDRALVVPNAIHPRHLTATAQAGASLNERVLYVGSAGLAEGVALTGDPNATPGGPATASAGGDGSLGIVGSTSETTLEGLAAVPDEWVIALDPGVLVDDPERAGREAGERATQRLAGGEPAVVTAAPDRGAVERTLAAGREHDLSGAEIRERAARALAEAASEAADPAGGLFVTGGDTAMAVFGALDAEALALAGEAVESGIPVGRIEGGPADGMAVVTKAGGFGGPETVVNCLRYLGGGNDPPTHRRHHDG